MIQRGRLLKMWPHYSSTLLIFPQAQSNTNFPIFSEPYPFRTAWDGLELSYEGMEIDVA